MSKKSWVLFIVLVAMVAMLSSSTSFYFFKSKSLEGLKDNVTEPAIESESTVKPATSSSAPASNGTLKPTGFSNRPSSPSETYTIEKNETLFMIAQKFDQTWTEIMQANGMADADKIQAGKTIVIPENRVVSFGVNQEKADKLQKSVDAGKDGFRLSPLETAKADSSPIYGLASEDKFNLESSASGSAVVVAVKDAEKYLIKLSQPCTKGEKGIWAIEEIAPAK